MTPKMNAEFGVFLSKLTAKSEILAVFGRDCPHSFYKVFVRENSIRPWWRVKKYGAWCVKYDPYTYIQDDGGADRLGALTGPIKYLLLYEYIDCRPPTFTEKSYLTKLHARVVEICGEPDRHLQIVKGPRNV